MARVNQSEKQERIMAEFSRISRMANKPGFKQNRLVDKLIEAGAIRKAEAAKQPKEEKARFTGRDAYAFIFGNKK
jgi:hypothetical protein